MDDKTQYIVAHSDESRTTGNPASSVIPTVGAATTAIDSYRTIGIHSTNLPEIGAAFTDVAAVASLSRIAEGDIRSWQDLEAAESALQAILLHEVVHVVVHAPKVDFGNGLVSYRRWDDGQRSDFAFDLMSLVQSRDFLVAPEFLTVQDGNVASATFENSPLLGKQLSSLQNSSDYWNTTIADAVNAAIAEHGVPAYLTDPLLLRTRRGDDFAKGFYSRLRISWNKATDGIPPVVCTFRTPPLLSIVLDRLNSRADLKQVISEIRTQLAPARAELREFNSIVTAATTEQEIEARVQRINQSFDAIVTEAKLSPAQRVQRNLAVFQRVSRPLVKFMAGFVTKTGHTVDQIVGIAPAASQFLESDSVVNRTVTAKTFADLVRIESIQSLVKHHFSSSEIASIEKSLPDLKT